MSSCLFADIPEFTLDQDPSWGGHEAVREIPGLQGGVGEAEALPPEV